MIHQEKNDFSLLQVSTCGLNRDSSDPDPEMRIRMQVLVIEALP